jgi:hypothetical protein
MLSNPRLETTACEVAEFAFKSATVIEYFLNGADRQAVLSSGRFERGRRIAFAA